MSQYYQDNRASLDLSSKDRRKTHTYISKKKIRDKKWRDAHPEEMLLRAAKQRSKRKNIEFSIDKSDIHIPSICPILEIPLVRSDGLFTDNSPSLDRIDSSKGYVKGNVWVISWRANSIKSDASIEELTKVVSALTTKLHEINNILA